MPTHPRAAKPTEPHFSRRPQQRMAVVAAQGDPNVVLPRVLPALYKSVYTLKFSLKKAGRETFKVGALYGRWPNLENASPEGLSGQVGLPVPAGTRSIPQPDPAVPVQLETWTYGQQVAEILHLGPYSAEPPTVDRLRAFIADNGYEIAGPHEEEYLTSPRAKVPKTLIRYPVRKKNRDRHNR